jgi:oxaloacetate decarboxylase alpha subunit
VDLEAVARSAPVGISEEDAVLWAEAPEATSQLLERRRSLGAEAAADAGVPTIDRELLEMLVDVVETAGDTEVIVEVSGARVTVRPAGPARAADRGDALAPVVDPYEGLVRVESPMVGTFYRAPSPDADPFVMEGQRVKAGEVLCLIEAMKLFNEIVAEQDGTVRHIHAENEEPVEFGQLLFIVEP